MPCAGGWVVPIFSSEEKRERRKKQVEMHPASRIPPFFFLFFLSDNPLALRYSQT